MRRNISSLFLKCSQSGPFLWTSECVKWMHDSQANSMSHPSHPNSPLAVLKMTLHLGQADAAFVVLPPADDSASFPCWLPVGGCIKVIHPPRLAADEGCLIDQGPIYWRRAGCANEEHDLPALLSRSRQENAVCSPVLRRWAAQYLKINCCHILAWCFLGPMLCDEDIKIYVSGAAKTSSLKLPWWR